MKNLKVQNLTYIFISYFIKPVNLLSKLLPVEVVNLASGIAALEKKTMFRIEQKFKEHFGDMNSTNFSGI